MNEDSIEFLEAGDQMEAPAGGWEPGSLPNINDLLDPFLRVILDEKEHPLPDVVQRIADRLKLSQADRERRIPTGKTVIEHRTGWARTSLVRAGLVEQPRASVVQLTDAGRAFLRRHADRIDTEALKRECPTFAMWLADMGEIPVDESSDRLAPTVWMVRAGERGSYTGAFVDEAAALL